MDEMRERIVAASKKHRSRCAEFLRELIAIASPSRGEEAVAMAVRREMLKLGYPTAEIDRFGNVIGRIGHGRTQIVLDAHLDTTEIGDRSSWRFDPYLGDFKAGKIYGHGATNNKGGLAAIVYAGAIINELDLAHDCTVYVIGSIQVEHCEGLAYKAMFDVEKLSPHYVLLSMPTGMRICCGQRGRAEIKVTLRGQPVHASTPGNGFNAIYGLADIIDGVKLLNDKLPSDEWLGKATVAVTHVACDYNGFNALPESCSLVIDRRMLPGEQLKRALAQIKELCKGTRAKIDVVEYDQPSYRGLRLPMHKYFPTWSLAPEHPLVQSAEKAYRSIFKKKSLLDKWTMSTAGAYTMGIAKVPTIGFGPGEEINQGAINDHVRVDDLEKCMAFYASLPANLPMTDAVRSTRKKNMNNMEYI